jgi:hypothetical protein
MSANIDSAFYCHNEQFTKIHYKRMGTGTHNILFTAGALGTVDDFAEQMKADGTGFDLTKFTMVAWDPPGYGQSRPPGRHEIGPYDGLVRQDAVIALALMKVGLVARCSLSSKLGVTESQSSAVLVRRLVGGRGDEHQHGAHSAEEHTQTGVVLVRRVLYARDVQTISRCVGGRWSHRAIQMDRVDCVCSNASPSVSHNRITQTKLFTPSGFSVA